MTMTEQQTQRVVEAVFRMEGAITDIAEIKVTMKELAVAVSRLAVVEERQSQDRAEIGRVFKRLDDHAGRIHTLEVAQPLQNQATNWVNKAIWLVVGAVVSAVVALVVINRATDVRAPVAMVAPAR
jgi:hypothetical protein